MSIAIFVYTLIFIPIAYLLIYKINQKHPKKNIIKINLLCFMILSFSFLYIIILMYITPYVLWTDVWNYIVKFSEKAIIRDIISGAAAGLAVVVVLYLYELIYKRTELDIVFDKEFEFNFEKVYDHRLLHFKVINKKNVLANKCKVFLISFDKQEGDKPIKIITSHRALPWFNETDKAYDGFEIPGKGSKYVAVFGGYYNEKYFQVFYLPSNALFRQHQYKSSNGTYHFTLQVVGSNIKTVTKKFKLEWEVGKSFSIEDIKITELVE